METKHTPGPWVVRSTLSHPEDWTAPDGTFCIDGGEDWAGSWSIFKESDQENGCPICHNNEVPQTLGTGLANACLIAAAPELLEALQAMLERYENEPDIDWSNGEPQMARDAIAKATGQNGGGK